MGDLTAIKDLIGDFGTLEHYKEQREYILSHINERTEYIAGGLVYCKNCKGVKVVDIPRKNVFVRCVCACAARGAQKAREIEDRKAVSAKYKAENENALPAENRNASFYSWNDGNGELTEEYLTGIERCEAFCRNIERVKQSGRGIWLYGNADSGKTYITVAMLKELQDNGETCIFTTWNAIQDEIKATFAKSAIMSERAVINKYASSDILFLDDFEGIVTTKKDSYFYKKFYELISIRFSNRKPTIITSRVDICGLFEKNLISENICTTLKSKLVEIYITGNQRRKITEEIEF